MINYDIPWHVLDIDTSGALNGQFDADKFRADSDQSSNQVGVWNILNDNIHNFFNKDWIDYLERCGISVSSFMLFYKDAPLIQPEAHIDVFRDGNPCIYAFNWVISPIDDSYMVWYDVDGIPGQLGKSIAGTSYQYWKITDIQHKELSRRIIGNQLTMVRTGIPHNIVVNNYPRWVVSLRCKFNSAIVDWNSAVNYYSHIFKDNKIITS